MGDLLYKERNTRAARDREVCINSDTQQHDKGTPKEFFFSGMELRLLYAYPFFFTNYFRISYFIDIIV